MRPRWNTLLRKGKQVGSYPPRRGTCLPASTPVTLSATPHACLSSAHLNCARLRKSHDFSLTCHQRSRGNSTVATIQVSGMQHQFVQHGRNFTHATEGQLTKTEYEWARERRGKGKGREERVKTSADRKFNQCWQKTMQRATATREGEMRWSCSNLKTLCEGCDPSAGKAN